MLIVTITNIADILVILIVILCHHIHHNHHHHHNYHHNHTAIYLDHHHGVSLGLVTRLELFQKFIRFGRVILP